MFTGIVQDLGTVADVESTEDGVRLRVRTPLAADLRPGDSIAVNGCCLTAVGETERGADGPTFLADVMHESLRRTSLQAAAASGARVNLELAMAAGDRFGGHIVQGHVDGTGRVVETREDGFSRVVRIAPEDPALLRYVVEKGSITVDGVSLTVSDLADAWLEVSLIPETLERTTLGRASAGTPVNLEVDVLAKHVEKLLGKDRP
ncbi:riboflavin synthase [Patulibacter brassicae]|uniref:Riboflavin synthase n=1 Tax=Patulibacter brassicae TaxID=1705717 RepID=A0ABU4VF73_9ACTN|nr:riboflavin synthase [Patulibacter brassicae]MDX8150471.1 riboflavin synthase [Patulibacter brassicae]